MSGTGRKSPLPMALLASAMIALPGCSMASHPAAVAPPVPASWPVGDAYLQQSEAAIPAVSYRDIFADSRLQALIGQALDNNRDLRVAAANLAAARAQVQVSRAEQLPHLDVAASANRISTAGGPGRTALALQGGISSFELDLFGRLASATAADRNRELASEAAARTVRLGVVAELAQAWALRAYDAQLLRIASDTAASARRSVGLTRARLQGGVAPRTDLRQAEQVLATAEADLAAQRTALAQDANLLQLLVGAPFDPALLVDTLEGADVVLALPAGTRSEVLLRRPDVLAAEYRLKAANAEIGVARAALFPRISLTGLAGFASNALDSLFTSGAFGSTLGAATRQSIFAGGGVAAQLRVSEAQRDAALGTYEKAIQTAFREVADALARQGTIDEELRAVASRTAAATDSANLVEARYRGGVASYLDNLDARRSLYSAQRQEAAVRLAQILNRITVYRVLGGDQASSASAGAKPSGVN